MFEGSVTMPARRSSYITWPFVPRKLFVSVEGQGHGLRDYDTPAGTPVEWRSQLVAAEVVVAVDDDG